MKSKMALIGKNISHSRSKQVYEEILEKSIEYELLDYGKAADIPELKELLATYPRISITSPYKNDIFQRVDEFRDNEFDLESVNAIKLENNKVIATNTDIKAFDKIFSQLKRTYPGQVIVLGDGNMGKMIMNYFDHYNYQYKNLSRKQKTLDYFAQEYNDELLVINTCARDYVFNFQINEKALLWDMNYNQKIQKEVCEDRNIKYLDGYGLLIEQAKFALSFWN